MIENSCDTQSQIKPVETKYKGYKFRSRLEARWAVFFDALDITWEYEVEGYDLGKKYGWYLPDFYLPQVDSFCEIKPEGNIFSQIQDKYFTFTNITKRKIILIIGSPRARFYPMFSPSNNMHNTGYYTPEELCKNGLTPLEPELLEPTVYEDDVFISNYHDYPKSEHRFYGCPGYDNPMNEGIVTSDFCDAISASRSARFEHGESP